MQIASIIFIPFFIVVVAVYYTVTPRLRVVWLALASLFFYGFASIPYLLVFLAITTLMYGAGLGIDRARVRGTTGMAKGILAAGIATPLAVLFTFKYFDFFSTVAQQFSGLTGLEWNTPRLGLILPLGLSFYTFGGIAYLVEVYRRTVPVERNAGIFSLYMGFFPQIMAGPIPRPGALIPQFYERRSFDFEGVTEGLARMVRGFALKLIIADRAAILIGAIYPSAGNSFRYIGIFYVIAVVLYSVQIYADFAGYSDMAIGAARVLGIRLGENFRRPYLARSVADFWRRWHISLTSWFRDYVYIPLGGNRVGPLRRRLNVMIVFILSGLWHGANWTFVLWGALHGLYMVASLALATLRERAAAVIGLNRLPRLRSALAVIIVFTLVTFAWIFFRGETIGDVAAFMLRLPVGMGQLAASLAAGDFNAVMRMFDVGHDGLTLGFSKEIYPAESFILMVSLGLLWAADIRNERREREGAAPPSTRRRWIVMILTLIAVIFFGMKHVPSFIYFDF